MFKKYLTLILTILVINLSLGATAFAETKEEKTNKFAEKVKTNIAKLGTGRDAQVEVKLKDKTKLRGYIGEAGGNGFSVIDAKTGAATKVLYPQVRQVKGNNLSTGAKVAIGLGILAAALAVWLFFENYG